MNNIGRDRCDSFGGAEGVSFDDAPMGSGEKAGGPAGGPQELPSSISEGQGAGKADGAQKSFFANLREKASAGNVLTHLKTGLIGAISFSPVAAANLPTIKKQDALNVLRDIGKAIGNALAPLKNLLFRNKDTETVKVEVGSQREDPKTLLSGFKEEVTKALKEPTTFLRGQLKNTPNYEKLLGILKEKAGQYGLGDVIKNNRDKAPEVLLKALVSKLEEASKSDPEIKAICNALKEGLEGAVGVSGSPVKDAGQFLAAAFFLRVIGSEVQKMPIDVQQELSKGSYGALQKAANQHSLGNEIASNLKDPFEKLGRALMGESPSPAETEKPAEGAKVSEGPAKGETIDLKAAVAKLPEKNSECTPEMMLKEPIYTAFKAWADNPKVGVGEMVAFIKDAHDALNETDGDKCLNMMQNIRNNYIHEEGINIKYTKFQQRLDDAIAKKDIGEAKKILGEIMDLKSKLGINNESTWSFGIVARFKQEVNQGLVK